MFVLRLGGLMVTLLTLPLQSLPSSNFFSNQQDKINEQNQTGLETVLFAEFQNLKWIKCDIQIRHYFVVCIA
jgi:hypothetical protein